jgi:hypothetical protein
VDVQQWLDDVRGELKRQKLPLAYRERLTSELSDHLTDFLEDCMSMDAQQLSRATGALGLPREIAHAAGKEYRKGRFAGRHPIVAFVLLPIVALPLAWLGLVFAIVGTGKAIATISGVASPPSGPPEWLMSSLPLVLMLLVAAPVAVCAVLFCRLATRAAVSWKWVVAACCILALVGSLAHSEVGVPTRGPMRGKHGQLMLGLGLSNHPKPAQVFQFALPLAIGGLFLWRQTIERRRSVTA